MAFSSYHIRTDVEVQAEQLEEARSIITPRGTELGAVGEWEVTFPDGNVVRMTDEEWQEAQGDSGSSPDVESETTKEYAAEDETADREHESTKETETPEKPSSTRARKGGDDEKF